MSDLHIKDFIKKVRENNVKHGFRDRNIHETEFGGLQHADKPNIEEVGHPAVYDGCLQKKEVWQ